MKTYRVKVDLGENGWFVAQVTGLKVPGQRRSGVVTQGRDLDELAFMVRDAIHTIAGESDFAIQLLVPAAIVLGAASASNRRKGRRRAA